MTKVFTLSQLPEGHMHQVAVGDYDVLLANVDGEVFAIENKCSHYGFALTKGALCEHRVRCPLHQACFDVRTGAQIETPGMDGVPSFDVKVDGDDILVSEQPRATNQGLAEIPATAPASFPPLGAAGATAQKKYDYAVIGGGVAAANAVEGIREVDQEGTIVMVSKEKLPPYDRTKVSKALMSGDAKVDNLPMRSVDFYKEKGIDLRLLTRVKNVDVKEKRVALESGGSFTYDKILLASGSTPRKLKVPGANLKQVFTVRQARDGKMIRALVHGGTKVVVSGGSFIGLEVAASLSKLGASVTVVTPEETLLEGPFGPEIGNLIQSMHEKEGVKFRLGRKLKKINGKEQVEGVVLDNGDEMKASVVVVGIGVQPNTDYLTGLATNDDGGISVNNHLATDIDGVYVAGDIASYPGREGEVRIEHWKVAGQQGRVAGRNMAGKAQAYVTLPFFWSAQQGTNFRYVGHGTDYDKIVYDGQPAEGPFLAFYVKDKHVQAVCGMKRDGETAAIGELMESGNMPDVDSLVGQDWHALCRAV